MAVGDTNPLYLDSEYAKNTSYGDIVAPPTFLTAIRNWGGGVPEKELGPGGREPEDGRILAAVGATRQLGGGQKLDFFRPVRPGHEIMLRTRISDIQRKKGRSGQLVFIMRESIYTDEYGELLTSCIETKIAR
jgi:acyl dehydratase